MNRSIMTLVLLPLAACSMGTSVERFAPALHPSGIQVTVRANTATFTAELLAVSDTALLLLRDPDLVLAPYGAIRAATFLQLSDVIGGGETPDSATRERLRHVSRYPPGVTAPLLRGLLSAYHRDSLIVLKP